MRQLFCYKMREINEVVPFFKVRHFEISCFYSALVATTLIFCLYSDLLAKLSDICSFPVFQPADDLSVIFIILLRLSKLIAVAFAALIECLVEPLFNKWISGSN